MLYFLTSYPVGRNQFGSCVIAKDKDTAKRLLAKRRTQEKIISAGSRPIARDRINITARLFRQKRYIQCIHTLVFLGNLLINAKMIKPCELLADDGLLHEIVHLLEFGKDPDATSLSYRQLEQRLKEFDLKAEKLGF